MPIIYSISDVNQSEMFVAGRVGSHRKSLKFIFCLLRNLSVYSDPNLFVLTHPHNVQFTILILPYDLRPFSSLLLQI